MRLAAGTDAWALAVSGGSHAAVVSGPIIVLDKI
jgi:hypothetical protein